MDLRDVSDKELEAEVKRREKIRNQKPMPLAISDFTVLQKYVIEAVNEVARDGRAPKDFEHYLMEMALEATFGPNIWLWWNKNCR